MPWGTWGSWGTGGFGPSKKGSGHRTPNGQHTHHCPVHHACLGHRGTGFFRKHDAHCPGCRRERSLGAWGSHTSENAALGFIGLFFGGKTAKKSLWD